MFPHLLAALQPYTPPSPPLELFPLGRVVFFVLAVAALYPVGRWLRTRPSWHLWLVGLVGFLPFFRIYEVDLNLILTTYVGGEPRGFEFTLIDWIAAVLAICLPPASRPPPHRVARGVYFALIVASLLVAARPDYGLLAVWKLARMYFVLRVLSRAFEQVSMAPAYLWGLGCGLVLQAVVTVGQHYFQVFLWQDAVRTSLGQAMGTFNHPNALGAAAGLATPLIFAVTLARPSRRLAWLSLLSGSVAIVLSLSRASLVSFVAACVLVYVGSLVRKLSGRKLAVAVVGTAVASVVLAISLGTIIERFETAPEESRLARLRMVDGAQLMLQEHPLGIGINQCVWMLDEGGYGERVGIRGAEARLPIHNIYWLSAAELGVQGLIAFLVIILLPLYDAARGAWRYRNDVRGDVLLGCAAGLAATYAHAWFEYMLRTTETMYLFWSLFALIYALRRQLEEPVVERPRP